MKQATKRKRHENMMIEWEAKTRKLDIQRTTM